MKIKVCHVISDLEESHLIEAIADFSNQEKYEISFVFLGENIPKLYEILETKGYQVGFVKLKSRKELPTAVFRVRKIFNKIKPDIVHTHMVSASLAGLIAARVCGVKRRVHTRHHSSESHIYYPHAVYYDKFISRLSTRIIAISQIVEDVLVNLEGVAPEKVVTIPHGFDLAQFKADPIITQQLKSKYDLTNYFPVVGVISRFVHWKGIQFVIPAFKKISLDYPQAKLVLANANGHYSEEIKALLKENLEPSQYVLIKFESNVFDLYKNFDIFVHVPISREFEAFGIVYVEPLIMEVPSIFTLSGIANDFIKDKENALVVPYQDSESVYQAMKIILEDDALRQKIVEQGKLDANSLFNAKKMADSLDMVYSSLLR